MNPVTVYIGWDKREVDAWNVARYSLLKHSSIPVNVQPLKVRDLIRRGLYTRPSIYQFDSGKNLFDDISGAPMSTEFSLTRFLVPVIHQEGIAIFVDGDVLFLDDIAPLIHDLQSSDDWSIACVKHNYVPSGDSKMDGQAQLPYGRKNWSSVMAFNCNRFILTMQSVNMYSGKYLHQFAFCEDSMIKAIDPRWNWLVNEQVRPDRAAIAHFTLGGPWLNGWVRSKHDDLWESAFKEMSNDH